MFAGFCSKHWVARAVCGCLIGALVTPSISSMWHGDPQAKLPGGVQGLGGSLGFLPTGSSSQAGSVSGVTRIADATIPNQRYVSVWPDQQRKAPLGPTGPRGEVDDRLNLANVYTGRMGHPTGPRDGPPPSSGV
jgi:hypothetical protein